MTKQDDLFLARKGLDEICDVPDKIISVYSLEKHVWADSNSESCPQEPASPNSKPCGIPVRPCRPFLT